MIIDKLNEVLNSVESYTTMYVFCAYIKSNIHDIAHMTIEEVAKDYPEVTYEHMLRILALHLI